jgi:transposase InsO family protein
MALVDVPFQNYDCRLQPSQATCSFDYPKEPSMDFETHAMEATPRPRKMSRATRNSSHRVGFLNTDALASALHEYMRWYNTERISTKLKGLSPLQYRAQTLAAL